MVRDLGLNPSARLLVALEGDITSIPISKMGRQRDLLRRWGLYPGHTAVPRNTMVLAGRARSLHGSSPCNRPGWALTSLSMSRSGYLTSGLSRVMAGVERWNSFMSRL